MPPKRRRRFQGLYYHSSPPKVLPMNGQIANENGRKRRDNDVKLSTIRIWIHEKDIGKLTRILWAGQGQRLRQQASTNAKVKRFLTAVPYVMNSIKDVHQAVIDNSLETLQTKLEPPVPPALVTCRDANGLNLIHKAAGLGHATILEYLITTWPDGVHETDITGKTPLHWAASAKNNMRCYTLLTQAGGDEEAVDYKMKTPSFYRHKPHDIERAFLTYVPETPRVSPDVATDWDALSDDSGDGKKLDIKIPEMNGYGTQSNAESNENTSEAEMTEGVSGLEDEDMSKEDDGVVDEPEAEDMSKDDEGGGDEAECGQDAEETTPELENTADIEEGEEPEQTKQEDEEKEAKAPQDTNEDEKDAEDENAKDEEDETQNEKQQTLNLNDTTTNPTKDIKAEQEIDSTAETTKEESNENTETELKDSNAASDEKKIKTQIAAIKENKMKDELNVDKENKEEAHEEDSKTVAETLGIIKEEVKDNVKYLASKVKNVFTHNEDESKVHEKEEKERDEKNLNTEKHENQIEHENEKYEKSLNIKEKQNPKEDDSKDIPNNEAANNSDKENLDKTEKEEIENNNNENDENLKNKKTETENTKNKNEGPKKDDKENNPKNIIKTEAIEKTKTEITAQEKNNENSNNITENAQNLAKSIENSLESTTIKETYEEVIPTNENNKTEDDENNNHAKVIDNIKKTVKEPTDEDFDKINKSLQEYVEHKNNSLKEKQQEMGDKLDAIADNVNESVKETQQEVGDKLEEISDGVEENVKEKQQQIGDKLEEISDSVKENVKEKQQEIGDKLEEISDSVKDNLKKTQQGIGDKLDAIADNVEENVKETQQGIGDKLEEISDSVKENVKDMASKVKNIFISSSEDKDKLENESNDVVVHTESPKKKMKSPIEQSESSDETADEDEATQAVETTDNDTVDNEANDADDDDVNSDEADPNADKQKEDDREGEESPTSSLAIEGFVQGESEDNTVQSQTAAYVNDDEDTRIQDIIDAGDMEQLAQIVLNGDGQKLLEVEATEPEIQAFLKNVPNYMIKIRRVHEACRGGSLLNLQQALDRRKFAIAKDEISPNGATPLHVAVLFGHSDIVRYLSARFPETNTITDNDVRTALHYAAVINDNGHFYNLLLQLGANPKAVDKMGHTPEEYMSDESLKDTLSYNQLLKNFGAEELEATLLSDQGQIENPSYEENPIFKTEQGKYLSDNLADPLIKALTQVAHKRPKDPLQYLTNYLQTCVTSRSTNGRTTVQAAIHSGSSQTNSTALVNSKPSTPPQRMSLMNGHVKYDNTDEIEEDSIPQIDEYDDDDEGNDSDAALSKKLDERDEHGQSMLHFASARSHRKGGLVHLIEEAKADITYRDELYRTARDVALQANQLGNAKEIDRYLISLAIVGDLKPFEHFAISGYDHIIDVVDDNAMPLIDIAQNKGHMELAEYLRTIRPQEELREELHQAIRDNKVDRVKEIANGPNGKWLIKAKNYYGRTAVHIAILKESEEIVEHFINLCPEALKIGDNLERTPLHYAMGTNLIESVSRILIQNGAKRTHKDLKGRQPSYYFMNKADILRLQEEEDENR